MLRKVVVCLLLVPATFPIVGIPVAATASETYHGVFEEGYGYKCELPDFTSCAAYPYVSPSGPWNLTIDERSAKITGQYHLFTRSPECGEIMPCPFMMNLPPKGWVSVDEYAFANTLYYGPVEFDLLATIDPGTAELTLSVDVTGCPYGWDWWVIH